MRPSRRGTRAAVVAAAATIAVGSLAACGGPVEIDVPKLSAADARACDALSAELPDTLAEQARVASQPADAPGAAYGDPAIVVRCGVGRPKGFDETASCEDVDGVGYYIPDAAYDDQSLDITATTAGFRPRLEIALPAEYRPNGIAAAMAALAPLVKKHLRLVDACN